MMMFELSSLLTVSFVFAVINPRKGEAKSKVVIFWLFSNLMFVVVFVFPLY